MFRTALALIVVGILLLTGSSGAKADATYGGYGVGALATVEVTFYFGATPPLPSQGGFTEVHQDSAVFGSWLSTGPINGTALGTDGVTSIDMSVANVYLNWGNNTITADLVGGHAVADSGAGGPPQLSGYSDLLGLTLNGDPVQVTGEPNQVIELDTGKLVLNEQFISGSDTDGDIILNALHLYVNPVVDFRIGTAYAEITSDEGKISPNAPEPATVGLVCIGIVGFVVCRQMRRTVNRSASAGGVS
jgi:hypothetical protein